LAKLTTNGTLRMASATLRPPGSVNAGFTPLPEDEHLDLAGGHRLHQLGDFRVGRHLAVGRVGPKRTVLPTLPAAALSRLIAICVAVAGCH